MTNKKIVYVDMDDVLADFYGAANSLGRVREEMMWDSQFFYRLDPIPNSKYGINKLEQHGFDVWVLTQPLAGHPEGYADKAAWINKHFPTLSKKLIMTQNKGLHIGDYLIDDNAKKWKEPFEKNGGTFIHFPYGGYNILYNLHNTEIEPEELWQNIVNRLLKVNPLKK